MHSFAASSKIRHDISKLKDLLSELVAKGVASDPHDFDLEAALAKLGQGFMKMGRLPLATRCPF